MVTVERFRLLAFQFMESSVYLVLSGILTNSQRLTVECHIANIGTFLLISSQNKS